MRYLKSFSERISHKDLSELVLDIEDLRYELGDLGITMVIFPNPDSQPIQFNMLRHYLSGNLPDTGSVHDKNFKVILRGDFTSLSDADRQDVLVVIERIESIIRDFGLGVEVFCGLGKYNTSDKTRLEWDLLRFIDKVEIFIIKI
jgi:hypothetical protein